MIIESNEAFAAQACAVSKELKLNPKLIQMGATFSHPITRAILTIKATHELERIDGTLGLITMCIEASRYSSSNWCLIIFSFLHKKVNSSFK